MKKFVSYALLISYVIVAFSVKYLFQFVKEVLEALWENRREVIPTVLLAMLTWLTFSLLVCVLG